MPSFISVCLREQIRLFKRLTPKVSLQNVRTAQDKVGHLGAKVLSGKVSAEKIEGLGFDAEFIAPVKDFDESDKRIILYLHGGGYTCGSISYAEGFGSVLAAKVGIKTLCAAYRLAPENPFPAAVEDAFEAYKYLLENGYESKNIYVVGESAGGGLCFSLCLMLKEKEMELPAKIVAISPWSDLTFSGGSHKYNEKKDPTLSGELLRYYAAAYAPDEAENVLASPIFGDLSNMPPSLIFVGSREILLDDSKVLAEKLTASGSKCSLVVEEGLWHVYPLFAIPEAAEAIDKIKAFLELEDEKQKRK